MMAPHWHLVVIQCFAEALGLIPAYSKLFYNKILELFGVFKLKKEKMEEKLNLAVLPVSKRGLNNNRLWQRIAIKQDNIAAQRDRMFSTRL